MRVDVCVYVCVLMCARVVEKEEGEGDPKGVAQTPLKECSRGAGGVSVS